VTRAYDIHGLVRLLVHGASADAEVIDHWLAEFAVGEGELGPADVVWFPSGENAPPDAAGLESVSRTEQRNSFVRRFGDGWECWGPGHNFYALFQDLLLRRGASLVHGCSLSYGGERGVLLFARGGVGKSSIAFGIYERDGVRLLGDDITLVRSGGELLAFPTPFAIYPYHHPLLPSAVKETLSGRRNAQRVAAIVDSVPFGHRLGRFVRRRLIAGGSRSAREIRPGYVSIPSRELFPPERRAVRAHAEIVAFLSRGGEELAVRAMEVREAANAFTAVSYNELHLDESLNTYALASVIDLAEHRRLAAEVATHFVSRAASLVRVSIPPATSAKVVQRFVLDLLPGALSTESPSVEAERALSELAAGPRPGAGSTTKR
jgi:hypothetical protein